MADEFYIIRVGDKGKEKEFVLCQSFAIINDDISEKRNKSNSAFKFLKDWFSDREKVKQDSLIFDFEQFDIALLGNIRPRPKRDYKSPPAS